MSRPTSNATGFVTVLLAGTVVYLAIRLERVEGALGSLKNKAETPTLAAPSSAARSTAPVSVVPRAELSDLEKSNIALFSARQLSVAHITTLAVRSDPFRRRALEVPRGTGSGFIWDESGHVVTNFHVIEGADAARVTMADQTSYEARLVGASPRNDIAVLRIDPAKAKLSPVALGSSHDLSVGQLVFAIGSPFGLDYTLSTGVISGLGREIQGMMGLPIHGAIQTDAAINPGNSGGPLLDSSGRLIGMNTSILSPSGASAGIGFAVPADTIARVVPMLIRYGREVRPTIGVELAEDAVTQRLGLAGALIINVLPGTPAEKAKLVPTEQDPSTGRIRLGDVIVSVNDKKVGSTGDLYLALEDRKEGEVVTLTLVRGGESVQVKLPLALNVGGSPQEAP
jgi:S1-C subfamily serine protease